MNTTSRFALLQLLLILGFSAAATATTFAIAWFLFPPDNYVHQLFFRSWIQLLTTWLFWITVGMLAAKCLAYRREVAAYERAQAICSGPDFQTTLIWSHAQTIRQRFSDPEDRRHHHRIAFSRIRNALDRLHKAQSTQAMEDYLTTRGNVDVAELETSYTGIRYCVWLIPTLGFIGTVMGIGSGMANFAGIIQNAQNFQAVKQALPNVTNMLGTAFDTTLLALALSVIAVFSMSYLLKQEEQLLERIDTLCFDGICSLFQEHSTASQSIIRAIHENIQEISDRMNGNRGAVEQVMRRELPALISGQQLPMLEKATRLLGGLLKQIAGTTAQLATAHAEVRGDLEKLITAHGDMRRDLSALTAAHNRTAEDLGTVLRDLHRVLHDLRRQS